MGSEVYSYGATQTPKAIPAFLGLTENEDAADINTNQRFFNNIGVRVRGHQLYIYPDPAKEAVPHSMVAPTEVSQDMRNQVWQSLYQETFRFLTEGKVDTANMASLQPTSSPVAFLQSPVS